jgi:diguanylate cyclase (GGDEF)-like protein
MPRYREHYGFDSDGIKRRLALLGLEMRDREFGTRLRDDVIAPRVDHIVSMFYTELLRHPEMRRFLSDHELIAKLRETQKRYLLTLGIDFDHADYFEERLRVGMAHARVGVPLNLYLCAYRLMTQLIHDAFPDALRDDRAAYEGMSAFVLKVTMLDMSLAIETYHHVRLDRLEASIESLKEEESQWRERANTDALTGLANHAHIVSLLARAVEEGCRDGKPLCVVMADLDRFKQINDTHGHLVGDGVLREVAARLRAAVRDIDRVGRYGGEEFMIIFRETPRELAHEITERVRARVAGTPVTVEHVRVDITISAGLAQFTTGESVDALIRRADEALYSAKAHGRNRIVIMEHSSR